MHREIIVVEVGSAAPAGDHNLTGGHYGGIELPTGKRHRAGPLPVRRGRVEVNDLSGIGGATSADVENLAVLVHHGTPKIADTIESLGHLSPCPGAAWVDIPCLLPLPGVEDLTVRSHKGSGVIGEVLPRPAQTPQAAGGRPDLRFLHYPAMLVESRCNQDVAGCQHCEGGVPPAARHGGRATPG